MLESLAAENIKTSTANCLMVKTAVHLACCCLFNSCNILSFQAATEDQSTSSNKLIRVLFVGGFPFYRIV